MRLTDLLDEIGRIDGSVTVATLARHLDSTPDDVRDGLVALRASGRLGPEGVSVGVEACGRAGPCAMRCPEPSTCPFVVDLGRRLRVEPS